MTAHQLKPSELEALDAPVTFSSELTVQYRNHMADDHELVEAMMVSTVGADADLDPAADKGRLNFMMEHRHGSPFEQGGIKVYVKAPISVFREWHRHRIGFSYNEISGRYKVMRPEFYVAGPERPLVQEGKHSSAEWVMGTLEQYERHAARHKRAHEFAWAAYREDLLDGVTKEMARHVLGVGLYTQMVTTLNPRSCMAFLSLRQHHPDAAFVSRPMWEINQCANQLEDIFKELFPLTHELFVQNGRVAP